MKTILASFLLLIISSSALAGGSGSGAGPGMEMLNRTELGQRFDDARNVISDDTKIIYIGRDQSEIKFGFTQPNNEIKVDSLRIEEMRPSVSDALKKSYRSGGWEKIQSMQKMR